MMKFIIVAIVLAATVGSAQRVGDHVRPAGTGGAPATGPSQYDVTSAAALLNGNRRLLEFSRSLKSPDTNTGSDGNVVVDSTNNIRSRLGGYCPLNNAGPWSQTMTNYNETLYTDFGDFVHDSNLCDTQGNGQGKVAVTGDAAGVVYGGAAQDFGAGRANWETYGWSLFRLAAPPTSTGTNNGETPITTDVKIQGVSLHVIGNVGRGHVSGKSCKVKAVGVAIFNANQVTGEPTTKAYLKYVDLSGANAETFTWNSNSSALLYTDIITDPANNFTLAGDNYYWLRIKFYADYLGTDGSGGQCFVFWGLSSDVKNTLGGADGMKARWQEAKGGALGYSTTCLGAANAEVALPGPFQTFWNCWNNGVGSFLGTTKRRCSTYRNSFIPAIPTTDCLTTGAQFNDFNYAFSGFNAYVSGAGGLSGGGGAGK